MLKKFAPIASFAAACSLAVFLAACGPKKPGEEAAKPTAKPTATPSPAPTEEAAAPATTPPDTEMVQEEAVAIELKDPVAKVNGEPITRAELDEALNEAVSASGMQAADLTADQKMEGYRQILDDLIMDKLISKASADIEISQEEVDAEIAKLRGQFPGEEEFSAQLEAIGQTPESLAETLKKIMRQRQWVESQLGAAADVTDEDVKKFYDENISEFERPAEVKASHILLLVKPDDSEDVANAQLEKAKEAAARAKKGGDFTALAKELSEEPGAAQSGGDLGYFSQDRMVPEFSDAAFGLEVGAISEPVRTQFGWHVIKVEDKKEAGTSSLEEVKEQLSAFLKADKQRKAVEELMQKLRGEATIENTLQPQGQEN